LQLAKQENDKCRIKSLWNVRKKEELQHMCKLCAHLKKDMWTGLQHLKSSNSS